MKYSILTKEEYDKCMLDFEFKSIFNKICKLKNRLDRRKIKILNSKNHDKRLLDHKPKFPHDETT